MHEKTFRRCVSLAGINPYLCEMANIRDQCSWVHHNKEKATSKAIELTKIAVAKVRKNTPLKKKKIQVTKRALVIGGGISGIQAALDISEAGIETILVERTPSIGGRMAMLDKTFPTLDCSACILTPRMVEVAQSDRIILYSYSEVEDVSGFVGNFEVKIRKKARYVEESRCTGCGSCWEKCPIKVPSEFDLGLGKRKAIYIPFPQAVPKLPVIDSKHCLKITKDKCGLCSKICPREAINYEQKDEIVIEKVGAIVMATGFTQFDYSVYEEYGGGKYKDVITGLHFERLVSSSGPTEGHIIRPSDHKEPKNVVFIHCVGSRDEEKGKSYCSRLCCMYIAKHALLLKDHCPDSQAYVFYMDIRAAGKNYEEFVKRVQTEYGAKYIRGRVSKIYEEDGRLIVKGSDTLLGEQIEIEADLVVLAVALEPQPDALKIAQILGIPYDEHTLFTEAHPKLAPSETVTSGIFLTGACQFPKDIPDTVASASSGSAKAIVLLSTGELEIEPQIAKVNQDICSGCFSCINVCSFSAIEREEIKDRKTGEILKEVAKVIESVCHGCGCCVATCRAKAIDLDGFTDEQIFSEVAAL
jgi:heterodisulfide reductase subunit A